MGWNSGPPPVLQTVLQAHCCESAWTRQHGCAAGYSTTDVTYNVEVLSDP